MRNPHTCLESLESRTLMSTVQAVGTAFPLGGTPYGLNGYVNYLGRKVVADNQGNLLAIWVDDTLGTVQVQSFHPDGSPRSAVFDTRVSGGNALENIAVSGDGKSFAVAWMGPASRSNVSVFADHAQLFTINTPAPGGGIDSQITAKTAAIDIAPKSRVALGQPYAAMDYAGTLVVAWQVGDGSSSTNSAAGVHAQRYSSTGALVGQEISASTLAGKHSDLNIVMNRTPGVTGNFVLAWTDTGQDNADGSAGVYARVFRNGSPVTPADVRLNQITAGDQKLNSTAIGPDGGFVATWVGPDGDQDGQYIGRFDPNANPLGGDVLVNEQTAGNQFRGRVAINSNGDFVVAWCDGDSSGNGHASVYGQAFAADGTRIGANFFVGTNDGLYLDVTAEPNDTFVIAWGDHTLSSSSGTGTTFGQEYQILS
jgi:hypothetical protein